MEEMLDTEVKTRLLCFIWFQKLQHWLHRKSFISKDW